MKRVNLLPAAALVTILLFPQTSAACSCAPPGSPKQELEQATAVFSGKVVEVKRRARSNGEPGGQSAPLEDVEVIFEVLKSWKGVEPGKVSVHTARHSAACGIGFRKGASYLVYAHADRDGQLTTGLCSRTKRLSKAREDLAELGAGQAR